MATARPAALSAAWPAARRPALFKGDGGLAAWERARIAYPSVAVPTGGTIYVSGTSPASLPAGNDTTGDGTAGAPYATLTKAVTALSTAGNVLVLCDGTFSENTSGRWVLAKLFTAPVVFDSYTGLAADFIITNTSGTSGVVNVRANRCGNIQIRRATIRSSTDSNFLFYSNPASSGNYGSDIAFFDCVMEARTQFTSEAGRILSLVTDYGVRGLHFVRCEFKAVSGGGSNPPAIMDSTPTTLSDASLQPHQNIGFWGCWTSGTWRQFGPSTGPVGGIAKFTIVECNFSTNTNHALKIGNDSSGDTTPKVTNVYIYNSTFTASGSNAHAILVGSNVQAADLPSEADGVTVKRNTVTTGLQGIVIKGATNVLVERNTVNHTVVTEGGSSLYAKASTGTRFRRNVVNIDGSAGLGYAFHEGADGANLAGDTEFTDNTINATGNLAKCLAWDDGAASTGGAVSDRNAYRLSSNADLGVVRGVTVNSLAEIQAAWVSDGLTGDAAANDAASTVVAA